jgi:hypothetical protein
VSWLRRILGGGSGDRPVDGSEPAPPSAGKEALLELLRARGAHSALVTYDGGNDEGGVASIAVSAVPLGAAAEEWQEETLPGGADVLWGDWSEQGAAAYGTRPDADERLLEAAEAVVCEKWGGFAGEFQVEGRLVVDVDAGRIARQDVSWVTGEDDDDGEDERVQETEIV